MMTRGAKRKLQEEEEESQTEPKCRNGVKVESDPEISAQFTKINDLTETESKETLDAYANVLKTIIKELKKEPELLKNAPHTTPGRLDEVKAARQLNLRWVPHE